MQFISAKDAADKWNISQRRVAILCSEDRVEGAQMVGNMWIIPSISEKPDDARISKVKMEEVKVKPFVKWAGGKTQLLQIIKENLPQGLGETIKNYAEPMVGGGALLFDLMTKYNFEKVFISDVNNELINAYKIIRDNVDKLIERLESMQIDYYGFDEEQRKLYYYSKRNIFNQLIASSGDSDNVEKAALFIFLNKTCFNGLYRVNSKGQFNVPMGSYKKPLICDSVNLINISELLQKVEIVTCDFTRCGEVIEENTFVYFDPPYRPLNKTASFTSYAENGFGDKEQIELSFVARNLSQKGAKVMLSNSDPKNTNENDNFFDDLYKDFNIDRVFASRMINSSGTKRGKITELLIKNY